MVWDYCRHRWWQLLIFGLAVVCTLANPVAQANPFTPLEYQPRLRTWNGDQNGNFIDDRLDPLIPTATNRVDIIVLLNKCLDPAEARQKLQPFGNVTYVGQHMTFVTMTGVKSGDLPAMAALADVAMIEQDAIGTYNLDVSTRAIRVRDSTTFNPFTVEIAFPGIDGTGIGIAVLDSGVDDQGGGAVAPTHTYFPAAKVVGTYDAVADNEAVNPDDAIGHGTHVAGIALGTGGTLGTFRGVAPNANLIDMLIGSALPCTSAAMRAVDKCIARKNAWGICVIQTSFSIGANDNGQGALCQIFNYAVQQGLVVVAAAGNGPPPTYTGVNVLACPAAADDAITVANFDDMGTVPTVGDAIAGSSNFGPRLSDGDGSSLDELKPDVAAPGSNITSAQGGSTTGAGGAGTVPASGTSMAAPHVSGVAALICQAKPGINPLSVKDLIKRTADDRDGVFNAGLDPVFDVNWGQGAVNAFNALSLVASSDVAFPNSPPTCCGCPDIFTASAPEEGTPNTLTVVVRNNGPGAVVNATISFGVYIFGNGAAYYSIATRTISIPVVHPNPAATVNVSVPWTPQGSPVGDPHACLKAQIGYGPDTVYGNNSCQRNIDIKQTSTATYRIQVENNLELPAVMEIVPRGQINDRWLLEIPTNNFLLDPFNCPRVVPIRLTSPLDAQPEEMVHIVLDVFANQFGNRTPQGGVEIIGCKPGGEPPTITEGEPFPGGREIIVADTRSGIAYLGVVEQENGEVFIPPHGPGDRTVVLRARRTNPNATARFLVEASDCATNRTQKEVVIPPQEDLRLQIAQTPTGIVLSWMGAGAVLEAAPTVTGQWSNSVNQANPQMVTPVSGQQFFRLRSGTGPGRPVINSVIPLSGAEDDLITIAGRGFDPNPVNTCVFVGGLGARAQVITASPTQLVARIGPVAQIQTGGVMVVTGTGTMLPGQTFQYPEATLTTTNVIQFIGSSESLANVPFRLVAASPDTVAAARVGGALVVTLAGNWRDGDKFLVDLHLDCGGGKWVEIVFNLDFEVQGGGAVPAAACAAVIADIINQTYGQQGVAAGADASGKITISKPGAVGGHGSIKRRP